LTLHRLKAVDGWLFNTSIARLMLFTEALRK